MKQKRERKSERVRREGAWTPQERALVLSLPHAAGVANPSLSTIYQ